MICNTASRTNGAMMMYGEMRMMCVMGMRCVAPCWRN